MAPEQIEKAWDGWAATLAQGFEKTQVLIDDRKTTEATRAFRAGVGITVRRMYTEVASTSPKRFAKLTAEDWSEWARGLYLQVLRTEKSLSAGKVEEAEKSREALRQHYYELHQQAGIVKANDVIYRFNKLAAGAKPSAQVLKRTIARLSQARPSVEAAAHADDYAAAKAAWQEAIEPILEDGTVEKKELRPLREAAGKFYKRFGVQFE